MKILEQELICVTLLFKDKMRHLETFPVYLDASDIHLKQA